jgi:isopentenyl-diphosphate delta-isomerase
MSKTESRKSSHIKICLEKDVEAHSIKTGFDDIRLVHTSLPEMNAADINLSTTFCSKRLFAPIIFEAMTGGTKQSKKINSILASVAESLGIAMGVGSQRVAIENPELVDTFKIVRETAPNAFLIANIGAAQLAKGFSLKKVKMAIDMIAADALAIHLNPLQEAVQPEGEANFAKVADKLGELANSIDVPIIVKETGAGISAEVAKKLEAVGIRCIDVSGAGGTSWSAVEYYRASEAHDIQRQSMAKAFWDWGIPTAVSIVEVSQSTALPVIASGGVRTGVNVAKAIALGADLAGMALPLLRPALVSQERILATLKLLIEELKTAMFLSGAKSLSDLKSIPIIITGFTAEWLKLRGFNPESYARRTLK